MISATICPGSGDPIDVGAIDGNAVGMCPRCRTYRLALPVADPRGGTLWVIEVHNRPVYRGDPCDGVRDDRDYRASGFADLAPVDTYHPDGRFDWPLFAVGEDEW